MGQPRPLVYSISLAPYFRILPQVTVLQLPAAVPRDVQARDTVCAPLQRSCADGSRSVGRDAPDGEGGVGARASSSTFL